MKMKLMVDLFRMVMLCVAVMPAAVGQSNAARMNSIKSQPDIYSVGECYDANFVRAEQGALAQLACSIFTYVNVETVGSVSTEHGVKMEESIKTTSMINLKEVTTIVDSGEYFHVFCYIPKSTVDRIFREREQKVRLYIDSARVAEKDLKLGKALRYYYWALLLSKTLPDAFMDQGLSINLHDHIPEVLNDIKFTCLSSSTDWVKQVKVSVYYHGRPVKDCVFTYWNGKRWTESERVEDGQCMAEYTGTLNELKFKVEYVFAKDAKNIGPELQDLIQMDGNPSWNNLHIVPVQNPAVQPRDAAQSVPEPIAIAE